MENEIWLPIIYGNGKKEISSFGRVRNALTKMILKSCIDRNGYSAISFWVDKKNKSFKIHRLVAEHFLPPVEGKNHVNHKDFNKLNNHIDNLEWCTLYENIQHYYRGKYSYIVNDDMVLFIRKNIESIGATKLGRQFNLDPLYVLGVANGTHRPNVYKEFIRAKKPSLPQPVLKYDMNGNFLKRYDSIGQAAKDHNCDIARIQKVITGMRRRYKGFLFVLEGQKWEYKKISLGDGKHRPIAQYTINGEFVATHKNKSAASRSVGLHDKAVALVISGEQKTAGGFIFKYA